MKRTAGVLAHLTSVPDLGSWLRWMRAAGLSDWQVLPVGPTHADRCPYASPSSFAGDPALVGRAPADPRGFDAFVEDPAVRAWLEDWALYAAIRRRLGRPWYRWPVGLRRREPAAMRDAARELVAAVAAERRAQWRFRVGWARLRRRARTAGIRLLGDLPFYPAHDSADVWARPDLFRLDARGRIRIEAGVPPDRFARRGQRWSTPLYRWSAHRTDGYAWWVARIRRQLDLFDRLRIDHFRGLVATWGFLGPHDGRWYRAPGAELLGALPRAARERLFAEDLGRITPAVESLRDRFDLPGMRVLQFAWDAPASIHHPARHPRRAVVYTGTHDNDTAVGWFRSLRGETAGRARAELGGDADDAARRLVAMALASRAETAIVPLQDLFGLDSRARMNVPGRARGNWRWRIRGERLDAASARRLRARIVETERLP